MAKEKTIFRIYPDGEVIALFPQIAGDDHGWCCESYMHAGQHGGADTNVVIRRTRLAKPKEYRVLLAELKQIGYKPKIMKRCTYEDFLTRGEQVNGERTNQ